jgi:aspartyl aminopeptidase
LKSTHLPSFDVNANGNSPVDIDEIKQRAGRCMQFLDSSPDPYHCVRTVTQMLQDQGFVPLIENGELTELKKGKYFFTRDGSSLVAFVVGDQYNYQSGFKIIGAHTDRCT